MARPEESRRRQDASCHPGHERGNRQGQRLQNGGSHLEHRQQRPREQRQRAGDDDRRIGQSRGQGAPGRTRDRDEASRDCGGQILHEILTAVVTGHLGDERRQHAEGHHHARGSVISAQGDDDGRGQTRQGDDAGGALVVLGADEGGPALRSQRHEQADDDESHPPRQRRGHGQQYGHDAGHGQTRPGRIDQSGLDRMVPAASSAVRAGLGHRPGGRRGDRGNRGVDGALGVLLVVHRGIVPHLKRAHVVH